MTTTTNTNTNTTAPAISRYPVPALADLPEDIRTKILEVQEKAGFVPNVFLAFAHRPAEFRAFFAYHDAQSSVNSYICSVGSPTESPPIALPIAFLAAMNWADSVLKFL